MTSFHLLPPYHQPLCIRRLAARMLQASYLQKATSDAVTAADDNPLDWSSISSNVIATVLGAAVVAGLGSIFFLAYQVPRQQEQILDNQVEMKQAMRDLTDRLQRLEVNDRQQNERLIRQELR
jgi:hypothetical protein